jgi:integrase
MGIYKRGDSPYWWMKFKIDGRQYGPMSTNYADEKLAQLKYEATRTDILRGKDFNTKSKITLKELIEEYLKRCVDQPSYKTKLSHFRFFTNFFKERLAKDLTPEDIEDYREHRKKRVIESSINRELTTLKNCYYKAIRAKKYGFTENPVAELKYYNEEKFKRERFLSSEERKRLLPALAKDPYLLKIVIFAMQTGMRQGEIRDLLWKDVNMQTGQIVVRAGVEDKNRYVPMFLEVKDILKSLPKYGKLVFSNPDGSKLSRHGFVTSGFEWACKRAKVENFRFHDLRHAFVSDCLMAGIPIVTVARYTGHATTTMTERYGHLTPEYKAEQIMLLPSALKYLGKRKSYVKVTLKKRNLHETLKSPGNQFTRSVA